MIRSSGGRVASVKDGLPAPQALIRVPIFKNPQCNAFASPLDPDITWPKRDMTQIPSSPERFDSGVPAALE